MSAHEERAGVAEHELRLADGRRLKAYARPGRDPEALTVLWHHGSPQSGAPLAPLLAATARRGMGFVSYARPSYGGSDPLPGRDVASAAGDVVQLADALGLERFAVMGASGGGPHALACGARLGSRVVGVACLAGIAPRTDEHDWFAGMVAPGGLRAAVEGRAARERYAETAAFDEESFTPADWAALAGGWSALGADAGPAGERWPGGLVDDDLAFVAPWGFELAEVEAPVLLVQGGEDRVVPPAHAQRLLRGCPQAEAWWRPRDGHVSVLDACPVALDWLAHAALQSVKRPE